MFTTTKQISTLLPTHNGGWVKYDVIEHFAVKTGRAADGETDAAFKKHAAYAVSDGGHEFQLSEKFDTRGEAVAWLTGFIKSLCDPKNQ